MNMPVLPASSSSPAPADAPMRSADATTDSPGFSTVLSQQQGGTAAPRPQKPHQAGDSAEENPTEQYEPLGPDQTLSLILDSAALPLMQATAPLPAETDPAPTLQMGQADTPAAPHAIRQPAVIAIQAALIMDHQGTLTNGTDTDSHFHMSQAGTARVAITPTAVPPPLPVDEAVPASTRESTQAPIALAQPAVAQPVARPLSADDTLIPPESVSTTIQTTAADGAPESAAATLLPALHSPRAIPSVTIASPLFSAPWPQDFSRQVLQLSRNITSMGNTVQMHVNPPELGPIHITLHVGESIAQASFVSPHVSVRQALENALPHLEQQLAQVGLSLGQANVGDQHLGQQAQDQAPSARHHESSFRLDGGQTAGMPTLPAMSVSPRAVAHPNALVDTFA